MIPAIINNQSYFFTVDHITRETPDKHIYGIRLNAGNYFLSKTLGRNDCEQLDKNAPLDETMLKELCDVITQIELKYKTRPTLELINKEIFSILARMRNPLFRSTVNFQLSL